MTHEEFYSAAFLALLPISAKLHPPKDIVKEAHNMALTAVAYWQEQLQYVHQREAGK